MYQHPFPYEIIYSNRKTLAIQITSDSRVRVRAPRQMSRAEIESFLTEKESWVLKHLRNMTQTGTSASDPASAPLSDSERRRYIHMAREIFTRQVCFYANRMNVSYGRISIREQKTRWGSCSSAGNLNFNWRLIFAPPAVLDYVVVHELAHRKEMNHSAAFYAIVEQVLPDYRSSQKLLRENGHQLWPVSYTHLTLPTKA